MKKLLIFLLLAVYVQAHAACLQSNLNIRALCEQREESLRLQREALSLQREALEDARREASRARLEADIARSQTYIDSIPSPYDTPAYRAPWCIVNPKDIGC